ncbi:pyridine nucleotide-disulfide oxidoreductase [Sulfolobus acidocaldarius SUSAZ]|nr:pyridine nucleotide-disulfide oxidoreductase [Sulfolobus acidocaldarius SUSAZ]
MRVVILGGGFAGLSALKTYRDAILIDEKNYFVLTHRLVDVVRTGNPEIAKLPYRKVLRATVKSVDFKEKKVITTEGTILYDKLIITLGYSQRLIPGSEKLENIEDALRIREKLRKERKVAVLGGGALSVELAGHARELGKEVYLVEERDKLLGFMSKDSSEYAKRRLEEMGVNLYLKTKVEGIDNGTLVTTNGNLKVDLVISGVGFKGPEIISRLRLTNINSRMLVNEYLRSEDFEDVYGAGDCATTKSFIPMSAQVAVQAGERAMLNAIGNEDKFRYKQLAVIVKIGSESFGDFMGRFVRGDMAELAKRFGIFRAIRLIN